MCGEDLFVSFCRLVKTSLARSKETLEEWHGVVGPLPIFWGEEFAGKSVVFLVLLWCQVVCSAAHRGVKNQRKARRVFDGTLGYPGEDLTLAVPTRDEQLSC